MRQWLAAAAAALVIAVIAWWVWPATRPSPTPADGRDSRHVAISPPPIAPRLSIVVLPFANLSNDPEQQYFADGITEDLTTDLSRIADMFVISRNTAFTYRNKPVDTKQIGRELGVRYVLEGSVRRSGNQVRVNAQLIDAETDAHLWAERFDRDIGDLFALQNEITRRIAIALKLELIVAEAARPTEHPDALDYILRGRAVSPRASTRDNFAQAIGLFEHALALDPQSVEAQTLLASVLAGRVLEGMTNSRVADIARAKGLVEQALATSPGSTRCTFRERPIVAGARGAARRLSPNLSGDRVQSQLGGRILCSRRCKVHAGAIEEVIPLEEQAIRLSPRDPVVFNRYLGSVKRICCNRAPTRRSSGSKRRAAPIRRHRSLMPVSPPPTRSRAKSNALAAELTEARRLIRR